MAGVATQATNALWGLFSSEERKAADSNVRNTFIDYALPKCTPDGEAIPQVPRTWCTDPALEMHGSGGPAMMADNGGVLDPAVVAAPKIWHTELTTILPADLPGVGDLTTMKNDPKGPEGGAAAAATASSETASTEEGGASTITSDSEEEPEQPQQHYSKKISPPMVVVTQEDGEVSATPSALPSPTAAPPVWKTDEIHLCDLILPPPGMSSFPQPGSCGEQQQHHLLFPQQGPLPPPPGLPLLPPPQHPFAMQQGGPPMMFPPPMMMTPRHHLDPSELQRMGNPGGGAAPETWRLEERQREIEREMRQLEIERLELRQKALQEQMWDLEASKRALLFEPPMPPMPGQLPSPPPQHQAQQEQQWIEAAKRDLHKQKQQQQTPLELHPVHLREAPHRRPEQGAAAPAVVRPVPLQKPFQAEQQQQQPATGAAGVPQTPESVAQLAPGKIPNLGSLAHGSPDGCNPCAFLHKDPRGCLHGFTCKFCHLCPPGELKRRKREKILRLKQEAAAAEAAAEAAEAADSACQLCSTTGDAQQFPDEHNAPKGEEEAAARSECE